MENGALSLTARMRVQCGALVVGTVQTISASLCVCALVMDDDVDSWRMAHPLVAMLVVNAVVVMYAVHTGSERCALAIIGGFSMLFVLLALLVSRRHPDNDCTVDDTALGSLVAQMLWTEDACVLMVLLRWVALAATATAAILVWVWVAASLHSARAARVDGRRIAQMLAALPIRHHGAEDKVVSTNPCAENQRSAAGGYGAMLPPSSSAACCAICLADVVHGDCLRRLPCGHEYHQCCIDAWVIRQGRAAACPLCNCVLVAPAPGDEEV